LQAGVIEMESDHEDRTLNEDDIYLDIDGAHLELQRMGFTSVSCRQVRRWAEKRRLPFFKWQRSLYITLRELRRTFIHLQERTKAPCLVSLDG
jgi:hypothetical protein